MVKNLYTENDLNEIEKAISKFSTFYLLATLVFVAVLVLTCINWGTDLEPYRITTVPIYVIGVLWAIGSVFTWGMFGTRLIKYRNFVSDMVNGLEHEVEGIIENVSKNFILDNDLEFYRLELSIENQEFKRQLYFDASKKIPELNDGEAVKFLISGNYIKDVLS